MPILTPMAAESAPVIQAVAVTGASAGPETGASGSYADRRAGDRATMTNRTTEKQDDQTDE
ncbi:hypothetical protein [Roseovarius aestuariivivens]|uniref:hypothetical protein n=1 Tax=Roseovarius aestuariivivens TaxID=1888910 RepID=UPI0010804843|nr:hypothetical protein [Roseovarius aestuariivivens]